MVGRSLFRWQYPSASAAAFAVVARTHPKDAEAAWHLALAALDRRDWDAALVHLDISQTDDALHDVSLLLRAVARRRLGGTDDLSALRLQYAPVAHLYCCEAFTFLEQGRWGAASLCFDEALRREPDGPLALRFGALLYLTAGPGWRDPVKALELARRARAVNPTRTIVGIVEGVALLRLGKAAEAEAVLDRLTVSSEEDFLGLVHDGLSVARSHRGDPAGARKSSEAAEVWRRTHQADFGETPQFILRLERELRDEAKKLLP